MLSDYVTGLTVGYFDKTVSSQRAYKGIAKKMTMFLFVIVANQVDIIFTGQDGQLRNYILMLLIATEGISLTENFGKLGLPVPAFWLNALEAIKTKSQEGGTMTDLINKKIEEKMKEDKKND
jgi:toxin secretion/phage lysis holin